MPNQPKYLGVHSPCTHPRAKQIVLAKILNDFFSDSILKYESPNCCVLDLLCTQMHNWKVRACLISKRSARRLGGWSQHIWQTYTIPLLKSWGSETTPLASHSFQSSCKIIHPAQLWASSDALHTSVASWKIGHDFSKWIKWFKNWICQTFILTKNDLLNSPFKLKKKERFKLFLT